MRMTYREAEDQFITQCRESLGITPATERTARYAFTAGMYTALALLRGERITEEVCLVRDEFARQPPAKSI